MVEEKWDVGFFSGVANPSQLAPLIDALPGAFFFAKDRAGRFTAMNRAFMGALGIMKAEEILGKTDYDFFDHDLAGAYREEDLRVMKSGEPATNELWWVPNISTGDIHWYRSTKVPLHGKIGPIGIAGIMWELADAAELTADHRQMTKVAHHIERHYAERLTVGELAAMADLSSRQFQRVFKRIFRTGPIDYLGRVRARAAAMRLLKSNDNLWEIAADCGFYDQSHFTNQFRRYRGMPPAKFRKNFAGEK